VVYLVRLDGQHLGSKVATWRTVYSAAVLTKHALNFIACSWRLIRDRLPNFVSRLLSAVKNGSLRFGSLTSWNIEVEERKMILSPLDTASCHLVPYD